MTPQALRVKRIALRVTTGEIIKLTACDNSESRSFLRLDGVSGRPSRLSSRLNTVSSSSKSFGGAWLPSYDLDILRYSTAVKYIAH